MASPFDKMLKDAVSREPEVVHLRSMLDVVNAPCLFKVGDIVRVKEQFQPVFEEDEEPYHPTMIVTEVLDPDSPRAWAYATANVILLGRVPHYSLRERLARQPHHIKIKPKKMKWELMAQEHWKLELVERPSESSA